MNASWTCPVCGTNNDSTKCSYCQFEVRGSFAVFPSVTKLDEQEMQEVRKIYTHAQYRLGNSYYNGAGAEKDYAEAVKWYRKAAEQGHAEAQYALGSCYSYGFGVEQNYAEAVRWYREAADQGNALAQCMLGLYYSAGSGVERSYAEALKWYRKAADQGNALARFEVRMHDLEHVI